MSQPNLVELPLSAVIARWRPGSDDWTWLDEFEDLRKNPERNAATAAIRNRVTTEGIGFADDYAPVLLGNDGRVWDGHHRICVAVEMGIASLYAEVVPQAEDGGAR